MRSSHSLDAVGVTFDDEHAVAGNWLRLARVIFQIVPKNSTSIWVTSRVGPMWARRP